MPSLEPPPPPPPPRKLSPRRLTLTPPRPPPPLWRTPQWVEPAEYAHASPDAIVLSCANQTLQALNEAYSGGWVGGWVGVGVGVGCVRVCVCVWGGEGGRESLCAQPRAPPSPPLDPHPHTRTPSHPVAAPLRDLLSRPGHPADDAAFISVDRLGADVRVRSGGEYSVERIGFDGVRGRRGGGRGVCVCVWLRGEYSVERIGFDGVSVLSVQPAGPHVAACTNPPTHPPDRPPPPNPPTPPPTLLPGGGDAG